MKRITLEELQRECPGTEYQELYTYIIEAMAKGAIKPVRASGTNGKKPALYRAYWLAEDGRDDGKLVEELTFALVPAISNDYYLRHLDQYEKERVWVLQLNEYLRDRRDALASPESANERSFEIWGQEKFLKKGGGMTVLKHCGISPDMLCYYDTTEPMAGYTHSREVPQNLLILENKDTFYSMRRHLMEENDSILGVRIGTLIYGAGKGILRSFQDFSMCAEPYMQRPENHIYYLGDLDYEGIGIYENLAELFGQEHEILPFIPGYEAMLQKAALRGGMGVVPEGGAGAVFHENGGPDVASHENGGPGAVSHENGGPDTASQRSGGPEADARHEGEGFIRFLPETKEKQNRSISSVFFSYFPEQVRAQMKRILEADRYIPQEILSGHDL